VSVGLSLYLGQGKSTLLSRRQNDMCSKSRALNQTFIAGVVKRSALVPIVMGENSASTSYWPI
jgi:hypothetical protein